MIKLPEEIQRMLNALAFADAGEGLTQNQKERYLKHVTAAAVTTAAEQVRPASSRPQVALYIGSELSAEIMSYVVQTCSRLKHGLTVLTFQSDSSAQALLSPFADTLADAGINLQLEILSGDPISGLARYLRRHPEVAFLACNETGFLGRGLLNGSQRRDALPVPVVLVASRGSSAQISGHAAPNEDSALARSA